MYVFVKVYNGLRKINLNNVTLVDYETGCGTLSITIKHEEDVTSFTFSNAEEKDAFIKGFEKSLIDNNFIILGAASLQETSRNT